MVCISPSKEKVMKVETTVVRYALGETRYGSVFVAATERGTCMLQFIDKAQIADAIAELGCLIPGSNVIEDARTLRPVFGQIEAAIAGGPGGQVALDLRGTPFQQRVWTALRKVRRGQTATYTELAQKAGTPRAVRAVASACARNPVSVFVPCHRIVRRDGGLGGYRWGLERKRELLRREQEAK
jgi:AraC family transcriptional regulator of adaptative response/methylated-DNA-[protein]-cysteine methyltransferase